MKRIQGSVSVLLTLMLVWQMALPAYALEDSAEETLAPTEPETVLVDMQETLPIQTLPVEVGNTTEEDGAEVAEPELEEILPAQVRLEAVLPEVPQYLQTDYPQVPYAGGTVGANGSGITALAMVASYMTGYDYSPRTLAGYFGELPGSEAERLEYASDCLRLPWAFGPDWDSAVDALKMGYVVLAELDSQSGFTDSQHFVVLRGLDPEEKVVVIDPYGPHYSQQGLAEGLRTGFAQEQIAMGYVRGWIYDIGVMPDQPYIYVEEPPALEGMPLYDQTAYPDVRYGDGSISTSGCGIVSLAMVASYMTGHTYTPEELADYFGGYTGNNVQRLEYAADMLQLPWRQAVNWHDVEKALKEGNVAIVLEDGRSVFTQSQHFLVLRGITPEGGVLVNDAYGPNYQNPMLQDAFLYGFSSKQICAGYQGAWIFDVNAMPETPFIYEEEPLPYVEPRYPEVHLTAADMELLACMVWVEARGEPFEGQQAVAEVVLNRLVSGQYQDSVRGVILAENQFRSAKFLKDATPTQTQYEAVEQALYGPYVLPIDVMHFARYPVNENVWGSIGGHVFCHQWES